MQHMCVSMELDLEFGQGIVNIEMLKSKEQENNVIMSSMFVRKKRVTNKLHLGNMSTSHPPLLCLIKPKTHEHVGKGRKEEGSTCVTLLRITHTHGK